MHAFTLDGTRPVLITTNAPGVPTSAGITPRVTIAEFVEWSARMVRESEHWNIHVAILRDGVSIYYPDSNETDFFRFVPGTDSFYLDGWVFGTAELEHTFSDFGSVMGYIVDGYFHTTAGELRRYARELSREYPHDSEFIQELFEEANIADWTMDLDHVTISARDWAVEPVPFYGDSL